MKIGICCITYNRLNSLKRLLLSLENADYGDYTPTLLISIDKSDSNIIEDYANQYVWRFGEKKVFTHTENLGLRKHVIECGNRIKDYDALVVLEDDITVSPYFFIYTIQTVKKYQNDDRIAGISLYNFPINYQTRLPFNPVKSEYDVYMMNCAQSWGQIWMKRQWEDFIGWYEKNNEEFNLKHLPACLNTWPKSSWLKYHTRYCIEQNKFFVYPYESLSTNNNDIGTHVKNQSSNFFQSVLQLMPKSIYKLPDFDFCSIKYDGYFEPKFLNKYLGISEKELCIDIYGSKDKCLYTKYVVSCKILPYKVLKSFALKYKPIEANILLNINGSELFLYQTNINTNNNITTNKICLFEIMYGNAIEQIFKFYSIKYFVRKIIKKIYNRLRL